MKRCIVAADDFAYNAAVDDAIVALIEAGVVTATSCLTASPRWQQAARRLGPGLREKADIGVHLDLTEFAPLASHHALLVAACYSRAIDIARLRASIQSQLQRFEDQLHTAPDYIDGHRHVHQLPVVRDVLIELLAQRYAGHLPWVRVSRARADAGWKGRFITGLGSAGLAAACRAAGVATNSHLTGLYNFAGDAASYRQRLSSWLANAADRDVLMCHPASRIDATDSIAPARLVEYQALSSPWWKECIASHDVHLSRGVGLCVLRPPGPGCAQPAPRGGSSKVAEPHLLESAPRRQRAAAAPRGGLSSPAKPDLLRRAGSSNLPSAAAGHLEAAWPRRRWLLLGLALWLLATLGWRPLMLPDEGRYAEVAREMLLGDAWVPTLYGLPFFHKPPLMYWLDMAAMQIVGVNGFAVRIAPAIGGWLMGAALYLDLYRRLGPREATIALGVLATSPFFFLGAQYVNHDMLVAGLITVAIVCAQRAVDDPRHTPVRWVVAAWCAMAAAFLAKGLIGIVLPALVVGTWLLWQRRWREVLHLMHPLGLVAFALLALPWLIAMQWRFPDFLDYFFIEQHFRRYVQSGFNNVHPFWFFAAVVPLLTLPWSLGLPAAVRSLAWRRQALRMPAPSRDSRRLLAGLYAWWLFAVLLFFSLPSSKLVGYALPVLMPLSALLTFAPWSVHAWRWLMPVSACLCLALLAGVAWYAPGSNRDIGVALGTQLRPGDRVVFVDAAFFDVAFYAGLKEPPFLLSNWGDPGIDRSDNWRKELAHAGRFDAQGAAHRLLRADQVANLFCTPQPLWFVASKGWHAPTEWADLTLVHEGTNGDLLRARWSRGLECAPR